MPRYPGCEDNERPTRKRVRKGTKSCWECKRRKVKCIPSADPSICVGCRERHTRCRRQEYVDDDPSHNSEDSGLVRRMARMESMLEALMEKMSDGQAARSTISTPVTVAGGSKSTFRASADIDSLHGSLKLEMLRRELKTKLPCQSDLDALFTSSYGWWLIQQHMMPHLSNGDLIENDDSLNIELVSKEHPMKTARLLLCTAIAIQQLPRGASALNIPHEELLREKQDSLFSFVVQTVLSDDENMGNIEGVECFALQGLYEVNNGNLRRALLAFRKAITMAQLLGLHRIARESSMDSKREKQNHMHLWYQISRGERYLSVILGVPSSTDSSTIPLDFSHATSWLSPEDRYHRSLYYISGLILARNQGDAAHSFSTTQRIGEEFDSLASQMPPDWWSIPTEFLDIRTKEASAQFERVMCQVWHFELVTLLHIPFMLHAARDRRYEYSHISCLDASRNLIKRWIAIRGSRTSLLFSELLDFQAFTAATTLLLGLLGASTSRDDLLRERHADSELIEMVIQNFERSAHNGSGKSVSAQSISVIRLLQRVLHKEEPHGSLYIEIPFFGVIQASHGGAVQPVEGERLLGANSSSTSRVDSIAAPSAIENSLGCELEDRCNDGDARENDTVLNFLDEHFQFPQRMSIQDGSNVEWPLGDSDMVFFDSLVDTDLLGSWTV